MASPGDLVFYHGRGRWYERLIQWRTHGPYVHVEVVYAPAETIGALPGVGVQAHSLPSGVVLAATSRLLQPAKLQPALDWLHEQVSVDHYGWVDIADEVLDAVFPQGGLSLMDRHRFDCSHLATVFLMVAGYPLPPACMEAPQEVDPNLLARAVGILK